MRRNPTLGLVLLAATSLGLAACCGGRGFSHDGSATPQSSGPAALTVLIGSSGDAETAAVKAAAAAWSTRTGNTVQVVVASDLNQQLGQGFAGGTPPDVFYADAARVGDFARAGDLYPYGDQLKSAGFLDSLVKTYTYHGVLQCAPKDFSTLALVINTGLWAKARLSTPDVPKDWAGLERVATKLTSGGVTGLVVNGEWARLAVFMLEAGGGVVNQAGTAVTADTAQNAAGLAEVRKMLTNGSMKYAQQVDAGWGGEALGQGRAAMTIEGNWVLGALTKDYPTIKAKVVELPAGPAGKGTLLFSNCWGIAARSSHHAAAVDLVRSLTSDPQQMAFAKAFGVMPSTTEGLSQYAVAFPEDAAFAAGGAYGTGPVNLPGFEPVMSAFNTDLEQLATKDPRTILSSLQRNGTAALKGQ